MLFSEEEISKYRNQSALCDKCGLHLTCKSPKMGYTGKGEKEILIIAEAPGAEEDEHGVQLIGRAGAFLRAELKKNNIDLDKDCWKINAVNCRPEGNKKPTNKEIDCCRPMVEDTITELKPKFIWLMGNVAMRSVYNKTFKKLSISKMRGFCIPDRVLRAFVLPLYHPSYVMRNEWDDNVKSLYSRDIKHAVSCLKKQYPEHNAGEIFVLTSGPDVIEHLKRVLEEQPHELAFDYETTGLKPFRKGHKIVSISYAFNEHYAFAFPLQLKDYYYEDELEEITRLWKEILTCKKINKVAHNSKFEDLWSRVILGVEPTPITYCSMIAAHILDSRTGITGLKFQTYVQCGIRPYDESISKYLRSSKNSEFNTVDKAPLNELLEYNALDSLYTFRLMEKQTEELRHDPELYKAFRFFMKGVKCFCDMQMEGFCVDEKYYEEKDEWLKQEISRMRKEILSDPIVTQFNAQMKRDFAIDSSNDLKDMFSKVIQIDNMEETKKGNIKLDQSVLENIEHPLAQKIIELRKLGKIKNTYLAQFKREVVHGKLHPFFDLHNVKTYRSSSSMPNMQNVYNWTFQKTLNCWNLLKAMFTTTWPATASVNV